MKKEFSAKKELKKLKTIVECLPDDIKKITEGLVKDAAFLAEQLEHLRAVITEKGWSEEYQNGEKQHGRKPTVEADMYIKAQKSYSAIIKQLTDLMPSVEATSAPGAEILKFLNK